MSNRFTIVFLVCVVAFAGLLFAGKRDSSDTNSGSEAVPATSHTLGEGTGGVTLLEYGDFQCPACGAYYPIIKQIKEKYGDQITFQFRHFPLTQIHPNAFAAHRAAEAAGLQGKFFEMHDILYEQQNAWSTSTQVSSVFEDYAEALGLDMEKYKKDVASIEVNRTINADMAAGKAVGATSTPTFLLNGKKIEDSPRDVEGFSKLIDEALNP